MAKHVNQGKQCKVYVRQLRQWVELDEKVYKAYQNPIDAKRKRMQHRELCRCPKSLIWLCDGDCNTCEFIRGREELVSIDAPVAVGDTPWSELIEDEGRSVEEIICDRERLDTLFEKLQELDPEGRRICELLMEDRDEREIAKIMGFKNQSSVNYRKKKAFARLRELLDGLI